MSGRFPVTPPMNPLESPCNKICRLNPDNICIGCGRSLEEIGAWGQADARQRLEICQTARARKLAMGDLY